VTAAARPVAGVGRETPGAPVAAIIASLGGLAAITAVLAALPAQFPAPVLVVLHSRRSDDPDLLTHLLRKATPLPVYTGRRGIPLGTRGVTVVPGGYLAGVDVAHRLTLTEDGAARGGDTLLAGLAQAVGRAAIAVVLTGMLHDGAQGVRAIKRFGGRVIVQDPSGARAGSMPSSAIATGCVDLVLPLERIGPALVALTMLPGADR
jgi:two-component system, chemotaxis family, protein-glutamate methylesterase/glutaminase